MGEGWTGPPSCGTPPCGPCGGQPAVSRMSAEVCRRARFAGGPGSATVASGCCVCVGVGGCWTITLGR